MLKQRSDVPFEKEIETIDRLPKTQRQKIVENTIDFLLKKKKIETKVRLPKIHGQKIVETTVRFSICKTDGNYG